MTESLANLEATYGKAARWSEHKKGDHITFTTAEGLRGAGTIIWVQSATESIGIKYVVAPDEEGAFLNFALPSDIIVVTQE